MHYYVKNLQGDIVRVVNEAGNTVASYEYDAWGKLLAAKNYYGVPVTDPNSIVLVNPLRYRGYVYDDETGLYYLQSRYYDPTTCRFINADMYCDTQCALTSQEKPSGKFCFPGMNIRKYSLFCLLLLIMIFTGVRTVSAADMVARAKKNGKTVAKGKIVTDSKGVRYRFSKDKTYAENKWLEIDGVVYYFNSKGYAKTGWFTYRDET